MHCYTPDRFISPQTERVGSEVMDHNGSINNSPVEETHSTDLDKKEDIIYSAKPVATNSFNEKTNPVGGDADSVDSETAGMKTQRDRRDHA